MVYRYDVGDRVIVRDDLSAGDVSYCMNSGPKNGFTVIATPPMKDCAGQEVTISGICDRDHWAYGAYLIEETGDAFVWTDEMFSGFAGQPWNAESIADMAQLFQ